MGKFNNKGKFFISLIILLIFIDVVNKVNLRYEYKNVILESSTKTSSVDNIKKTTSEGILNIESNNIKKNLEIDYVNMNKTRYIPISEIVKFLNGKIYRFGKIKVILVRVKNVSCVIKLNSKNVLVENLNVQLDNRSKLINSKTFIPIEFLEKVFNIKYEWVEKLEKDFVEKKNSLNRDFSCVGISIGDDESYVFEILGQYIERIKSIYGFYWYVFHNDYKEYIQVGIYNGRVVSIYSNSNRWKSKKRISIDYKKDKVREMLDLSRLKFISKSGIRYVYDETNNNDIYLIDNCYITLFFDKFNNNNLNAIFLIDKNIEDSLTTYFGEVDVEIIESLEKQIINLTNSTRVIHGKSILKWNYKAAEAAKKHSKNMAVSNFFDHINLYNKTPFERMNEENIFYKNAAENIASGQRNSIYAHEAWMNSEGHRTTLLGNYSDLGVGIYYGGQYQMYYTQNFYTPLE